MAQQRKTFKQRCEPKAPIIELLAPYAQKWAYKMWLMTHDIYRDLVGQNAFYALLAWS